MNRIDLMNRFLAVNPKLMVSAELDGFSAYLEVTPPKDIVEDSKKLSDEDYEYWHWFLCEYTALLPSYEYGIVEHMRQYVK